MINGEYIFYAIQQRRRAEGKWGQPNGDIKEIKEYNRTEWIICGDDYWGRSINPYIGQGNNWRPKDRASNDDFRNCRRLTGTHGWFNSSHVILALRRLKADDDKGMYNSTGTYGSIEQVVRHEFRVVTISLVYNQTITPTTVEDFAFRLSSMML